jgi:hypothetical protein
MPRRRLLSLLLLATATIAVFLSFRRRILRQRERVDLYGEDGSMASIAGDSNEGERLLRLARELL